MAKPIKFNCVLASVRTRRDNSLGLSMDTPEMSNEEMLVMLRLRGINLDCTLSPLGEDETPIEVKNEVETKTPSERLRAVLFCLYKYEKPANTSFADFYSSKMERMINHVKSKLPEQ